MAYISSLCSYCCDKTPWPKATWGGRNLFHSTILRFDLPLLREARARTQGWTLEVETEAEVKEKCCLLACIPGLAQTAFLCCLGQMPRVAPHSVTWAHPRKLLTKDMYYKLAHRQILWKDFLN